MRLTFVYVMLFIGIFLYQSTMAQYSQGKENLIAPSPTVAAIAKFGQIPIGYNTGVPKISIPLYTLKCGDLTLPISMDYHAGGIRVNDVASWVGLGWSLNMGGAINIAVQGRKDLYPQDRIIPIDDLESSVPYSTETLQDFQNGGDTEPDIYNYQVGSYAGQFMVDLRDNAMKAYNVNGSKDITFDVMALGPIPVIFAKDQFGTKYSFGFAEETSNTVEYYKYSLGTNSFTPYMGRVSGSNMATAMPLAKMVNTNKTDSIIFNHYQMSENYTTQMNGSLSWGMSPSRTGWTEYTNPFPTFSKVPNIIPENYSKIKKRSVTAKVSTVIASNGTKIVLTAATKRNDLNSDNEVEEYKARLLDKIEIYDANDNLLKKWEFVYDYFIPYITNPDDNITNCRLKLIALKEYGSTTVNPQIYNFSYYGDAPGEPQLPYRNSFSGQDYWGFCNKLVTANDAADFKKSFPNINNFPFSQYYRSNITSTSSSQSISYTEGESKEPNADFLSACSLKKITYPTGGSTTFEYESNVSTSFNYFDSNWTNRMGGGQRIKKITSNPLTGAPTIKEYLYTDENGNTSGEITNVPRPARQKVWQLTGQDGVWLLDPLNPSHPSEHVRYESPSFDQSYLELKSDCSSPLYTSIGSSLTYSRVTETDSEGKTVYNFYRRQEYDYPFVAHEEFYNYLGCDVVPYAYNNFTLFTDDLGQLNNQLDSRNYDLQTEDKGYWGTYYKHGTLKSKEVYNKINQIVLEESYKYKDLDQKKITGLSIYRNPDISSGRYYPGQMYAILEPTYFYNTYCTLVGLCQLTGKTTTQYDVNGGSPVITKEEYTYNNDNLLVQIKSTNSSNDSITTINRYPSDINTGVYSLMKQRNMLNYPIEVIKKKNNMLTDSKLNTYKQVNGVSNFAMFLPAKVYQSKLTSPASSFTPFNGTVLDPSYPSLPELDYLSYNAYGKTCEIKGRNGITTSYLWSYGNQYPIAEIKNASYQDVKAAFGYSDSQMLTLNNNPNPNVADIKNVLGNYFTGRNAMFSTYTYRPPIGLVSSTDTKGLTTYYEYDNFQRLKSVKDQNGNIIKNYDYHYKN